ncbi:MAG: tetratricopeptide repeat protein [Deltaproteobacteria bacterium]|nr:tetratricopeptide repeat protein [Deltaproteobacteria bacterium]
MRTRAFAIAIALSVTSASIVCAPSPARAQGGHGVEEGRTRFSRGIELYKEGNFHAALAEFRAAYAAAPSYRIHYNLGQTLYQLQDYAGAVAAFEQYLAEGGDKVDAERKKEVESDLAKLRPRVAKLTISTNVPNAELLIDDEPRGKVQRSPALVSAGRRKIAVTANGYQTETRVLDVAGTQQIELTFELKPINGGSRDDRPSSTVEPSAVRQKSRTAFYVGLGTTIALGAGTAVMAIVSSGKHSDYEKALEVPNNKLAIDEARSSTKTSALVADILGGATIAAGALTILAYVLTSGTEPVPTTSAKVDPPKPVLRPYVGPTWAGLGGTF